jgi:hypothetical protein
MSVQACFVYQIAGQKRRRVIATPEDNTLPAPAAMLNEVLSQSAYETEPTNSPHPHMLGMFVHRWLQFTDAWFAIAHVYTA